MQRAVAMTDTDTDTTRDQFDALLESHRAIVFKVAGTYCRHPDDRDDLVQEIAAQLWRAWRSYDNARPFVTWMYRIALNVAIGYVRSESRRRDHVAPLDDELHDVADDGGFDFETEQRLRLLQNFIGRQAPLDRALLLLYLDERSQREIAEILGLSETNVSTKIGRLKQRIRQEL
jgi:RNA polymerase sigma-70 factor (ECF subfamily)